jgi:hypothetical protein
MAAAFCAAVPWVAFCAAVPWAAFCPAVPWAAVACAAVLGAAVCRAAWRPDGAPFPPRLAVGIGIPGIAASWPWLAAAGCDEAADVMGAAEPVAGAGPDDPAAAVGADEPAAVAPGMSAWP